MVHDENYWSYHSSTKVRGSVFTELVKAKEELTSLREQPQPTLTYASAVVANTDTASNHSSNVSR